MCCSSATGGRLDRTALTVLGFVPTTDREKTAVSTTEDRAAANLAVVGGVYEAFGRGDIDFILGLTTASGSHGSTITGRRPEFRR